MACRLSCVTGDGGGSCGNCGVVREYNGLCARCLKLPECKSCHRRLSENCFNSVHECICQVFIIIIIIILSYLFRSICIFCRLLRSVHALFFSRLLRFQACERKCRRPRIYRAIDDVITEIDIPTHPTDVSFEVFIDRQREYMIQTVREHSDRFGYVY